MGFNQKETNLEGDEVILEDKHYTIRMSELIWMCGKAAGETKSKRTSLITQ